MGASRRVRRRLQGPRPPRPTPDGFRRRTVEDVIGPAAKTVLRDALAADVPPWEVRLIHNDPAGPCIAEGCQHTHGRPGRVPQVDFGYTIRLHDTYGLPELHLAARATEGEMAPMTTRDLGETLNVVAAGTIAGDLRPGDTFDITSETDGGSRYLLRFELGPPQPRDTLSAYAAHPAASVVPVRWYLISTTCPHGCEHHELAGPHGRLAYVDKMVERFRAERGGPPAPAPISPETARRLTTVKLALADDTVDEATMDSIDDAFCAYLDGLPEAEHDAGHQACLEYGMVSEALAEAMSDGHDR